MTIHVHHHFDSGNIELLGNDNNRLRLAIRQDASSEFLQWFHFAVSGVRGKRVECCIENASKTTYPAGWENYHVACSTDRQHWFRSPSNYDGNVLSWVVEPECDLVWFAYFAPYSLEQHHDLIASATTVPGVSYECLGHSLQDRSMDYLHIGPLPDDAENQAKPRKQLWAIARQHPGESMTEWWMEGWLERLLDVDDATSRALRQLADIHVVPNMNPDGSILGHLRTNAAGVNLNREWASPTVEKSPEVYAVLQRMQQTGIDLSLDVHGDEALPYNFIAGTEGINSWTGDRDRQLKNFKYSMQVLNPDFQLEHGYPRNKPNSANMGICSNQLAERFGCLALTLEMPFKDAANNPVADVGWSPERSMRLGASFVDAVYMAVTDNLLHQP